MSKFTTRSESAQVRADEQTDNDLHPGRGVITMPTHDEIAHQAHDICVKSGHKQGRCEQNWRQAEQELRTDDRWL